MTYPKVYVTGHKPKYISRYPICLTDYDYNYILEEIGCIEKLSLKEMYKFILMRKKINMMISNEYYMYLLHIYILTIIRFLFFFFGVNLMFSSMNMYTT